VSDGKLSPRDIVYQAVERGLTTIALADHDNVDGIAPALAAARVFPELTVIPCVEISTDIPRGEVHVLGYFIDYTDADLGAKLAGMRNSRETRAQGMITKLDRLGIHVDWPRVREIAGPGTIGRPHIAQAMLEKGYITSLKEAFDKYIGRDGPAYVEREKMTPAEAVKLVLDSRGLPVLAHPFTVTDPETMIMDLKEVGLVGIEAYYNAYAPDKTTLLLSLAEKYRLIAVGGSDYHGLDNATEVMIGGVDVPITAVEQLIGLAKQRALI
jgi:hypothetical protein